MICMVLGNFFFIIFQHWLRVHGERDKDVDELVEYPASQLKLAFGGRGAKTSGRARPYFKEFTSE